MSLVYTPAVTASSVSPSRPLTAYVFCPDFIF